MGARTRVVVFVPINDACHVNRGYAPGRSIDPATRSALAHPCLDHAHRLLFSGFLWFLWNNVYYNDYVALAAQ